MTQKKKLVYVPMAVDFIHPGHLNIIKVAQELGEVMIGLLQIRPLLPIKDFPS